MSTQSLGFTLLELIVVIVIIAILAVISFPKFTTMKESSFDREAITNLKIIQDAEKYHKMETNSYAPCPDATTINTELGLSIPTTSPNWNYKVEVPTSDAFTAKAQRVPAGRVKCIDQDDDEPTDCPSY